MRTDVGIPGEGLETLGPWGSLTRPEQEGGR